MSCAFRPNVQHLIETCANASHVKIYAKMSVFHDKKKAAMTYFAYFCTYLLSL